MIRSLARSLPLVALLASVAGAQQLRVPSDQPQVRAAVERIRADNAWTLDQQASICEIPAPPFMESARAAEFRKRLEALGLPARIDSEGNVIAERRGTGSGPTIMIAGHLDTVFPEGTDVKVTREGTRFSGPGIGDDCRGLAVVLAVARAMQMEKVATSGTILFVGNVGEEGAGNLRGVRHLFTKELKGQIDYFISVDGTGLGITSAGVGSNRYHVTYEGPGGHSYGAFGLVNPIHALGRAIALVSELRVPTEPRTTFSVGMIEGGTSVNSISATASMDIDMRSEQPAALAELDGRVRAAIAKALDAENARWPNSRAKLTVRIDTIGIRPAGAQPDSAYIVRVAQGAGRVLGFEAPTGASSTDSNLPISLGIPAITIDGGGRGRGAHSLDESYDDGDKGWLGPQWAALVVASLAGVSATPVP
ncbi:MAG TPA: M20/M25/M40 family metallo-hydrolase [Gemmatimonadaceae bacterium]|nr:M20/M25/M40 family metallo-hydrolase [Gemmatimonadaceae bacterium]